MGAISNIKINPNSISQIDATGSINSMDAARIGLFNQNISQMILSSLSGEITNRWAVADRADWSTNTCLIYDCVEEGEERDDNDDGDDGDNDDDDDDNKMTDRKESSINAENLNED